MIMSDRSVMQVTVNIHHGLVLYFNARQFLLIFLIFLLFLSRNSGKKRGKIGGKKNQKIEMKKKIFFCCFEDHPSPPAGERNRGGSEHAGPRVGYILHQKSPSIGQQSMPHGS